MPSAYRIRISPTNTVVACLLFAVGALVSIRPAVADDWPTWRGDRLRTGVSGETLKLPLQQVWKFRSRRSGSAPVPTGSAMLTGYPEGGRFALPLIAAGESVFFSSAADGRVVCLDAATGKTRWEFFAGAAVNRTPMFWQGKIYAGSDDGYVYCLDAKTGKLLWKYQAAPAERSLLAYGKMISAWPVRTDVLVDRGVAYFAAGVFPHDGTFLFGLDANTGKLLWRNGTQCEDGYQISLAPGGHLYVTGKDIWVPKDFRGYSKPFYGSPTPFLRADGSFVNAFGSSIEDDPERPKIAGRFWPLIGVEKDGIRYGGNAAWHVEGEEKARRAIWNHPTPDRWTDFDSGIGVRHKGTPVVFRYDPDLSTILLAGDVVFHSAFVLDPAKGVGSTVYARDGKTGKVLWSVEIPERAHQLIVANGHLLAATRRGTIYCFASQAAETAAKNAAKIYGTIEEEIADRPFAETDSELAKVAETVVAQSGIKEGYALVLDCRSGRLAFELAKRTKLTICAVFADEASADRARRAYAAADLHLTRITALVHTGDGAHGIQSAGGLAKVSALVHTGDGPLPYPSYFADLILSESAALGGDLPRNTAEIARLQKPIRGVVLFGGKQDAGGLKTWAADTEQKNWQAIDSGGSWIKHTRPPLIGGGGWTHLYGDAGNTSCSHDGVLKAPLGVVWYGQPQVNQPGSHTAMMVNGILVVPEPNALEGCDQYTGRRLWRIESGGIGVSIAASEKHVYAKVSHVLTQIDLLSGKQNVSFLSAFGKEHPWGWFAVAEDGKTVYGAAGGGLFATEMESGQGNVLWKVGGPEREEKIAGLTVMDNERIYVLGGKAGESQRAETIVQMRTWMKTQTAELRSEFESQIKERDIRELIAIDRKSGKIIYRRGVDVSNCGGSWLRPAGRSYGHKRHYNPYVNMGFFARNGVVVISSESRADKGWGMWNGGAYKARATVAVDGPTGKTLWYKFTNHRTKPVIVDDTLHVEPWAFDLRTGKKKTRLHPITGEPAEWAWCRPDKQCGFFAASKNFLFGRNKGFGYQDLLGDSGLVTFWHSRSNCLNDHVSGGGLMIKPPQAVYCSCQWSLPFTVAMGTVPNRPAAAPAFAQPGRTLPVKNLHIDFGASGDRRDGQGRLWLASKRPMNHQLLLGYDLHMLLYEGGAATRRSAHFTPVGSADVPFLFASTISGLRRAVLPIARDEDGKGTYRARLGFVAPTGDQPGQRVFDVRLNGQTVVQDFDIVAAAGGANRAIWKEFTVPLEKTLVLELVAKTAGSDPERWPVIAAMEVLRERMDTLGMALDKPSVWLNNAAPMREVTLRLANLRREPFVGRVEMEVPAAIKAVLDGPTDVALQADIRSERTLQISASEKTPLGKYVVVAKLVDRKGRVVIRRTVTVEWLGKYQRQIIRGNSASIRQEPLQKLWSLRVKPNLSWQHLQIGRSADQAAQGNAAASYVWFSIPRELRGREIRRARIRLHRSDRMGQLLDITQPPADHGSLTTLAGPPWPDFNTVKYDALPKTGPIAAKLLALGNRSDQVEGDVIDVVKNRGERDNVYLAIEAAGDSQGIYWGQRAFDREKAPVLVIDYLPE